MDDYNKKIVVFICKTMFNNVDKYYGFHHYLHLLVLHVIGFLNIVRVQLDI